MDQLEKASLIAALNDDLRTKGIGGEIVVTRGVLSLGAPKVREILRAVRSYNAFGDGNDPYGEHDFGAIAYDGARILFKIDYYNAAQTEHSADPADPALTRRILTIMLADEY